MFRFFALQRITSKRHAGYSYSGPVAAWAYKCLDFSKAKRVFLLGPNHQHGYNLNGLALSSHKFYATPLGNLKLDLNTIQELQTLSETDRDNKKTRILHDAKESR